MRDPFAMETVYLSVIVFAGKAKTLTPLTYVMEFTPPRLPIGAGTNLSEALRLLMREIDTNVRKNTPDTKGDWKPLIFILTDGAPNDDYRAAAQEWRSKYGKYSTVAVLMGDHSDATALKAVTDNVLVFKNTTKESYQAFFKWVSSSIQTSSKGIAEQGKDNAVSLEKIKSGIAKDLLANELPTRNQAEYFVMPVRCQKTRKPYILRFVRPAGSSGGFNDDGSYPVDESYFELSGGEGERSVNANLISDWSNCPHCNNGGIGLCSCGNWLCLSKKYNVKCPTCGNISDFDGEVSSASGGRG